jgi:hypothetical protein
MPRKPTSSIVAFKPTEPEVKQPAIGEERNPIMPLDGPRKTASKLGKGKTQTIKISRPTRHEAGATKN